MTEAEWLVRNDPQPMLEFLEKKVNDRKLRLFACACCRRLWAQLGDELGERSRRAVMVAERYADGEASGEELHAAWDAARVPIGWDRRAAAWAAWDPKRWAGGKILTVAQECAANIVNQVAGAHGPGSDMRIRGNPSRRASEAAVQATILRDLFGPLLFRSVAFDPTWRTRTVVTIAQTLYDDRDFALLPVLADALEDAGCENAAILNHCRQPGEHVRGCWVVDLVLGKE